MNPLRGSGLSEREGSVAAPRSSEPGMAALRQAQADRLRRHWLIP
jgi:hypothetical protein